MARREKLFLPKNENVEQTQKKPPHIASNTVQYTPANCHVIWTSQTNLPTSVVVCC